MAIPRGLRMMVVSAFSFSVMGALVKALGGRLPVQELVLARSVFTLGCTWLLLRRAGVSPWGEQRRLLIGRGVFGFAALTCVFYALSRLPLAEATVLQYTYPIFTALLGALVLDERPGRKLLLAIALSTVGVVLVVRPGSVFGGAVGPTDSLAVMAAVLGAFFSADAYVVVRKLTRREHPLVIVFYFPLVSLPLSLPWAVAHWVWPSWSEWLLLLGMCIATQVGQVALTEGLRSESAARASSMSYLQIVFAAALGAIVFGDTPPLATLLGAALILCGTLLTVRDSR